MAGRTTPEEKGHVLMNKEERMEIKMWLTKHTILQWVNDGMALEDAKTLWEEVGQSGE